MSPPTLRIERIRELALRCGFDDAGVASPDLPGEQGRLDAWLDAGYAGGMEWLTRHREVRLDLRRRFPWARSVVMALRSCAPRRLAPASPQGLLRYVASYAWGCDYHDVLLPRLKSLAAAMDEALPGRSLRWHAYVDTGPVLERQLARAAGLGWLGKNTLLLNEKGGSWFFLGTLVTDLDPEPAPRPRTGCGSCRACQPACPTGAFVEPGVLDARRCISYLTIEHRGPIDRSLREAMGEWLFGCDLCQTACPFNRRAAEPADGELRAAPPVLDLSLRTLLRLDADQFRRCFRATPLWRPRREGLLRNALIVVGNAGLDACAPEARALLADPSPVVREAASWCVAKLADGASKAELESALAREREPWVRSAMTHDLASLTASSRARPTVT